MFRKKILPLLLIFTVIFSLCACNSGKDEKPGKFRVSSYIIADRVQEMSALHSEDFNIITDAILFGCASFDSEGHLTINDEILKKAVENIKKAAKANEITITLNVLGPSGEKSDNWEQQMKNLQAEHNKAFESGNLQKELSDAVIKYELDGIHFDYEYTMTKKAWKIFNAFLISLREEMPDKIIGVALSDWDVKLSKDALKAIDFIELMLYDNYDDEGRHSTYDICVKGAENKNLKHIPHSKIHFGLPFYARPTDHDAYWYDYAGYYDRLDENGFFEDTEKDKKFWFNTPEVIKEKTVYALNNNYGGVMIWHYSCDLPSTDPHSLLKSIDDAIINR